MMIDDNHGDLFCAFTKRQTLLLLLSWLRVL